MKTSIYSDRLPSKQRLTFEKIRLARTLANKRQVKVLNDLASPYT